MLPDPAKGLDFLTGRQAPERAKRTMTRSGAPTRTQYSYAQNRHVYRVCSAAFDVTDHNGGSLAPYPGLATANLRTKILDFRGSDSTRILRGGIIMPMGNTRKF